MTGGARPARGARAGQAALGMAAAGLACWLGAVLLYHEPRSFYTNFVLLPSVTLALAGTALDLVAIVVALRRPARPGTLLALGLALGAPLLGLATIQLLRR